jgi:hypothetical protein
MNILIFGATGFIGQDFIDRYSEKFENVYIFSRIAGLTCNNLHTQYVSAEDLVGLTDISCVLHFAFDHSYQKNIILADMVHSVCKSNQCNLIYLSSFVVRDIISGVSLKHTVSGLNDPYTIEKVRVKRYFEVIFRDSNLNILQIEPGIVFGINGGWFDHVKEMLNYKTIFLPNSGQNVAPFIYVGELSTYIYEQTVECSFNSESVLVASDFFKSWNDFYFFYARLMNRNVLIQKLDSNQLHSNYVVSFLMKIVIFTRFGKVLFKITPTLKYYFKILSKRLKNNKNINDDKKMINYRSYGITYLLQSLDFEQNLSSKYNDFIKINRFTKGQIFDEMKK